MTCEFCKKHIDEVDCTCKMCTRCGWALDKAQANSIKKVDKK
jgi:hypothetical protein